MQLLGADRMHASWPAGSDRRLPKRCMYPGALALYSELDIGFGLRLKVGCNAACGMSQDQVSGQPRKMSVPFPVNICLLPLQLWSEPFRNLPTCFWHPEVCSCSAFLQLHCKPWCKMCCKTCRCCPS